MTSNRSNIRIFLRVVSNSTFELHLGLWVVMELVWCRSLQGSSLSSHRLHALDLSFRVSARRIEPKIVSLAWGRTSLRTGYRSYPISSLQCYTTVYVSPTVWCRSGSHWTMCPKAFSSFLACAHFATCQRGQTAHERAHFHGSSVAQDSPSQVSPEVADWTLKAC